MEWLIVGMILIVGLFALGVVDAEVTLAEYKRKSEDDPEQDD